MRLAVVGGKLQGTEAAYLAGEAGYEVVLIDRPARPPGSRPGRRSPRLRRHPPTRRAPAGCCCRATPSCPPARTTAPSSFSPRSCPMMGLPLLFDLGAYAVTQSKLRSNALFERPDVPRPTALAAPAAFRWWSSRASAAAATGVQLVSSEPGSCPGAGPPWRLRGAQAVVEEFVAGAVAVGRSDRPSAARC